VAGPGREQSRPGFRAAGSAGNDPRGSLTRYSSCRHLQRAGLAGQVNTDCETSRGLTQRSAWIARLPPAGSGLETASTSRNWMNYITNFLKCHQVLSPQPGHPGH